MKCLWLTRKYPRPANSGELIYSDGLIRAFAATGVELVVIAHDNEEDPVGDGSELSVFRDGEGVEWRLGCPELGSRAASLFSRFPSDSWRLKNGGPERLLRDALANERWDAVIVDHAAVGWALGDLLRHREGRGDANVGSIVYISHNHEAKVRRDIARNSDAVLPKKWALQYDAEKYARQEEALCREADLVTAITQTEVEAYRENFPDQQYICLTPGFEKAVEDRARISQETPRRVIMSGSFEWIAKRMNLEYFLERAAEPLSEAGIEVQIVGKTDEEFRREMARKFPRVDFVGRVPEMTPYLLNARVGLIVEELGGGFKLKSLEYIFHRLPLAGLTHAVDGLPLRSPDHILLEENISDLVRSLNELIDDFDRLNRMKDESLSICRESFRWEDRGVDLLEAISSGKEIALPG